MKNLSMPSRGAKRRGDQLTQTVDRQRDCHAPSSGPRNINSERPRTSGAPEGGNDNSLIYFQNNALVEKKWSKEPSLLASYHLASQQLTSSISMSRSAS